MKSNKLKRGISDPQPKRFYFRSKRIKSDPQNNATKICECKGHNKCRRNAVHNILHTTEEVESKSLPSQI